MTGPSKRITVLPERTGRLIREDGDFVNEADVITRRISPFGEQRVVEQTTLFELKSLYGLSALRDIQNVVGGGSISHMDAEFKLETTASAKDEADLKTVELGRHVPGLPSEMGISVRLPNDPTGEQEAKWGLFDDTDGYFFGIDSSAPQAISEFARM